MRKGKGFLAFLILAVAVIGYAIFDFVSEKKNEEHKSETSLILNWKADQVDELTWLEGPEKMKLVRSPEGWKFTEPLQEKADSESITTFIEGLVLEKSNAVVVEGAAIDWKTFGLDMPKAKIKIRKNSGEEAEFLISAKKNFSGDSYFRVGTENKVFLVSSTWQQKAEKKVLDFRDRRWARLSPADVETIFFQKGKNQLSLSKKGNDWIQSTENQIKLDQNKVRKLLTDLTNNQVTGFGLKADSAPMAKLLLTLKDGKIWTGEFGVTKDKKHVLYVKELGLSMELAAQNADDIYRLDTDSLRDRSEPFQVRREDIKKIEINLGSQKWTMTSDKDKWSLAPGSTGAILNEGLLTTLLGKVASLQVAEFISTNDAVNKSASQDQMILYSGDGKLLLDLKLTGPQPHKVNGLDKSVYFVKSSLVPYGFTINESEWTGLDWKAVLTAQAKPVEVKGTEIKQ